MKNKSTSKNLLVEGKHWPEDYENTAFNTIKSSPIGQQFWYAEKFIRADAKTFINEFDPMSHKNSNLGFFRTLIGWFVKYCGSNPRNYVYFIEQKLDDLIWYLQMFLGDPALYNKYGGAEVKNMPLEEFERIMKPIGDEELRKAEVDFEVEDKGYEIIPILSYKELNQMFGGDKTGYNGKFTWCHTNVESTYETWTSNFTQFLFILARKGWEDIKPPDPKTTTAYDEYGTSLIAILVSEKGKLLKCTLRWNHACSPSEVNIRRTTDRAFLTYSELSKVTGIDTQTEIMKELKEVLKKVEPLKKKKNGN